MRVRRCLVRLLCVVLIGLLLPSFARALEPDRSLAQYQHTVWLQSSGAPSSVYAFAQTPDGLLWMASPTGLYRFDGAHFDAVKSLGGKLLPSTSVRSVATDTSGKLWIGYGGGGGIGVLDGATYREVPGSRRWQDVRNILPTGEGRLWINGDQAVWLLDGDLARKIGPADGLPEAGLSSIQLGQDGALYIMPLQSQLVYELRPGASRFVPAMKTDAGAVAIAPDGSMWLSGRYGLWAASQPRKSPRKASQLSREGYGVMLFDRDGGLWIQHRASLRHHARPALLISHGSDAELAADSLTTERGLSSIAIFALFQDRDGNVWMGTSKGVERFRRGRFVPIALPDSEAGLAVLSGKNGSVWAAGWRSHLMSVSDRGFRVQRDVGPGVLILHEGPKGDLWAGGFQIWHASPGGTFAKVESPTALDGGAVLAMTTDADGALWVSSGGTNQIAQWRAGNWSAPVTPDASSPPWSARALRADAREGVWLADRDTVVHVARSRRVALPSGPEGLDVGIVRSLSQRGENLWIGGDGGLSRFDGRHVVAILDERGQRLAQVSDVIELEGGDVWVHYSTGALRIDAQDLRRPPLQGALRVSVERFGPADGLRGSVLQISARPTMAQGSDGRLWFSTDEGVSWVDPRQGHADARMLTPYIRGVTVDGQPIVPEGASEARVQPATDRVEIAFGAIDIARPEHLRYRYRLKGLDLKWQEDDVRGIASYTHLAPGSYAFQVAVADGAGAWSTPTIQRLQVLPSWYQQLWFRVACVIAVLLAAALAYRLRVRQLTSRTTALLEVRQGERDRIGRELHDTLLQTLYAAILRFDLVAKKLPNDHPVRADIDGELGQLEAAVRETRAHVAAVRDERLPETGLASELDRYGRSICEPVGITFSLQAHGEEPILPADFYDDVRAIAREALLNAAHHSRGEAVMLTIDNQANGLSLEVRDDGVGMDDLTRRDGVTGHWGLMGMHERARRIGATLQITSGAGIGTSLTLWAPLAGRP